MINIIDIEEGNIAITLSGGADSSIVYYAICEKYKNNPNVNIIPCTSISTVRDWYFHFARNIILIVGELTNKYPLEHLTLKVDEQHWVDKIKITNFKKNQLQRLYEEDYDVDFSGCTTSCIYFEFVSPCYDGYNTCPYYEGSPIKVMWNSDPTTNKYPSIEDGWAWDASPTNTFNCIGISNPGIPSYSNNLEIRVVNELNEYLFDGNPEALVCEDGSASCSDTCGSDGSFDASHASTCCDDASGGCVSAYNYVNNSANGNWYDVETVPEGGYVFNNPECSNFSEPISSCHQSIIFILVCMPKYASRGCALKPLSDLPTGKEGLLQRFHCPQSNAENKKNIINLVIIII